VQSVLQASVRDGGKFNASAFCEDRRRSAEVNVGGCDVFDALMVTNVIVVLDEGSNLLLEISG
jgi:hypothetical protein